MSEPNGFGNFIKEKRLNMNISLREFCRHMDMDPSRWSKIERGLLYPPTDEAWLAECAKWFGMSLSEAIDLFNLARLTIIAPKRPLSDAEVADVLPAFVCTATGKRPTKEQLHNIIDLIRET